MWGGLDYMKTRPFYPRHMPLSLFLVEWMKAKATAQSIF